MIPALFLVALQTPDKPVHPVHPPGVVSAAPVTADEAREAFVRATGRYTKMTGQSLGPIALIASPRPATRAEIVAEMGRIFAAAEPSFRITPIAAAFDASKLRIDPSQRKTLVRLVTRGCVARLGPLATGPASGLTPKEFGDALGFFMARLGQMSHLPSPKWTPSLQGG